VAWPLAGRAQPKKLPTIGFIGITQFAWGRWVAAFEERLSELGWIDGRTIAIEYRWTEGRSERAAQFAEELAGLKVDVIFTTGTAFTAVQRATSVIPIVFGVAPDPVGAGFVASLSRPGGNATGLSIQATDLAGKRLQFLRQLIPGLRRPAILGTAYSALEMNEFEASARTIGLEAVRVEIARAQDIVPAIETLKDRADALYVSADGLFFAERMRIITMTLGARLPTVFVTRGFVESGGLMSYGASYLSMFRRAAEMIDKILHGAKPAEIPVEQQTQFELVFNAITAKALGLTIPETLLATADEVIQ
jgi:putative ABC transport system substrate-binding protein